MPKVRAVRGGDETQRGPCIPALTSRSMVLPFTTNALTTRRWLWLTVGWTLFAAVQSLLRSAVGVRSEVSLLHEAIQVAVMGLGWAVLTPGIGAWHRVATARSWRAVSVTAWHLP